MIGARCLLGQANDLLICGLGAVGLLRIYQDLALGRFNDVDSLRTRDRFHFGRIVVGCGHIVAAHGLILFEALGQAGGLVLIIS